MPASAETFRKPAFVAPGLTLSALTSHRVVPVAMALPQQNSETYGALLEAVVRSSNDAIITKSLSSIVTSWNPAATRIFGWEAQEMIGHSLLRLIPPRLHHEELEVIRRLRLGEQIENYETVRVTREGREIEVSLTLSPLRNLRGEIIGASKIARDITHHRAAERARLQLAAIVESSDDAIVSKGLDGIITSWNHAAERILGYTAQEIVGRSVLTLIPAELQGEETHIIEQLLAGRRIDHFETVRLRKNGERLPVSLSISPIRDDAGRVVGAAKILRDISRRKQLEDSVQRAEQLVTATRIANQLAHDINNPIESLTNLLYLIEQSVDEPDSVRPLLSMAEGEMQRVVAIAHQTLHCNRQNAVDAELSLTRLSETLDPPPSHDDAARLSARPTEQATI